MRRVACIVITGLLLAVGCSTTSERLDREQQRLQAAQAEAEEISRQLTTAVVDTLAPAAPTNRTCAVAYDLARLDQAVEGMPTARLDPETLRDPEARLELARRIERQLQEIRSLRTRVAELSMQLMDLGRRYEAERRKSWLKRLWFGLVGTLGLGGAIAAVVLAPTITLPLIGRLLGWLATTIPSLASWLGITTLRVVDQIVEGVGRFRREHHQLPVRERLDDHLKETTDQSTKRFIEKRRKALAV